MSQNIIDVSWDLAKFDAQTQAVLANMTKVYEMANLSTTNVIKPGSDGGFTELKRNAIEFNQIQEQSLKLTKLQDAAEQSRLRTQKLQQQALEAEAKARKANADAAMKEAKAKEQSSKSNGIVTVDGGSRASGAKEATQEQITAFENLRQAEAEASMSAAEYGKSVTGTVGQIEASTASTEGASAADKELIAAKLALQKALAEENVALQGYKLQTAEANKAAKEQAMLANDMLSPYQKLNKEYVLAQANAKDLAVQYGLESVEAKEAAATALELNTKLQTIDKTVGLSQRNVGNYGGAFQRALGRATNLGAIGGRAIQMLSRQIIGLGVGMLSFAVGAKALEYVGTLIVVAWNKVSAAVATARANFANMNDIMKDAHEKAGEQITDLELLYKAATDTNLSMQERLKAVKALQLEFPDYFKNIDAETIRNGDAKKAYDELTASIEKNAIAMAAVDKIKGLEAAKLDIKYHRDLITGTTDEQIKNAKAHTLKSGGMGGSSMTGGGQTYTTVTVTKEEQIAAIKVRRDKALAEKDAELKSNQQQIDYLKNQIGTSALAKAVETKEKKRPKEKKAAINLESTKNELDLEFEVYKIDQQRKIKLLDEESNDTKNAFQQRLIAAKDFEKASIELSDRTYQHEIDNDKLKLIHLKENYRKAKGTEKNNIAVDIKNTFEAIGIAQKKQEDARLSLEDDFSKKIIQITKDTEAERIRILQEAEKSIENVYNEQKLAIEANRATEKAAHDKLFHDKVINQEKYDDLEKKSIRENAVLQAQSDLQKAQRQKDLIFSNPLSTLEDRNNATNEVTKANANLISAQNTPDDKKLADKKKKMLQYELDAAKSVQDAITGLVDIGYQKQIDAIQKIIDLNNRRKDQELANINASTLSNQEKAVQMLILDNMVAANNRKLEREQMAIKIKQAKFDRDMAVLSITEQAAIGIVSALKIPVYGIAESIAIGAAAAAQIALVLAKPLPTMPAYAKGTENHPGGPAIVGEGMFKELVSEPGGKSFIASRPMLLNNLPKGSRVLPLTSDIINRAMYNSMLIGTANRLQSRERGSNDREIIEAIENGSRMTVQAMKKQRGANVNIRVDGYWGAYITQAVKE